VDKKRLVEIDSLRGIAMIAMILVHTCYYFIANPIAFTIWNYSELSVPVFIFCSVFLFFKKGKLYNFKNIWQYYTKRFWRLLFPFYVFLIFYIPSVYFFSNPKVDIIPYTIQSIFVTGGVDISWLVALFLELTILLPILLYLFEKQKVLFWVYSAISLIASIIFLTPNLVAHWRIIMWLPYSLIPIWTILFLKWNDSKYFYLINILGFGIPAILIQDYQILNHRTLSFFENKYPPNLYYLSFGFVALTLLYFAASKGVFKYAQNVLDYFSRYSYSLFFIHYFVLYYFVLNINKFHFVWYTFFGGVISVTVVIQLLFRYFSGLRKRHSLV